MSTPTATGPGRVLVAVYGLFALAATARGVSQAIREFDAAPLAYSLSVVAGVIYIVATLALAKDWRPVAWAAVGVELVGVLTVGVLTVVDAADFPDATVWSLFGRDYGFVPLILPFLGLAWLWRTGRSRQDDSAND
ncbi:hypothetical protein [Cellulomonas sp. NPDC089187]|uniref:hypothetical protein n=1 Tax=Cellulomonas sp. NPDC089187 TaxID=3154970 RepID=UPI003425918A